MSLLNASQVNEHTIGWFVATLNGSFFKNEPKIGERLIIVKKGSGRYFDLGVVTDIQFESCSGVPGFCVTTDLMGNFPGSVWVKSLDQAKRGDLGEGLTKATDHIVRGILAMIPWPQS